MVCSPQSRHSKENIRDCAMGSIPIHPVPGLFLAAGCFLRCNGARSLLITHRFKFGDMEEAYRIFGNKLNGVIQIAITRE